MTKRVEIISQQEVFRKAIFRIEEARLRHELYNGTMSEEIVRLNLSRGDSVAVILHNPVRRTVILTEQFRYPAYDPTGVRGTGWLIETPAGMIDPGESPADAVRREVEEEIGYEVHEIRYISTFFVSPGGTSERILLFYASVSKENRLHDGGGLIEEGEDIRVIEMPVEDALRHMSTGDIADAKTIIGLQWMQINGLA